VTSVRKKEQQYQIGIPVARICGVRNFLNVQLHQHGRVFVLRRLATDSTENCCCNWRRKAGWLLARPRRVWIEAAPNR
jgi:hypothetical protein